MHKNVSSCCSSNVAVVIVVVEMFSNKVTLYIITNQFPHNHPEVLGSWY